LLLILRRYLIGSPSVDISPAAGNRLPLIALRRLIGEKAMKLLTEYLEHALSFERMAEQENNPELKAQFQKQASAYRKLAADRAARYGMPAPSPAPSSRVKFM
jgi:hypothetical protein